MNCYLCFVQTRGSAQPALGMCRTCGAGICEQHLIRMRSEQPIGMASLTHMRCFLLCSRCAEDAHLVIPTASPSGVHSSQPNVFRLLWQWWVKQREVSSLPEPTEAVALVERLLKRRQQEGTEE